MIVTNTPSIEGRPAARCRCIVIGEAILGIDLDDEVINNIPMAPASGTAVSLS
jgi:uncharacterized protein YbjQ (UPF0145 family)